MILPAADCPAKAATRPEPPRTIATLQFERINAAPYRLTSDDLLVGIAALRQNIDATEFAAFRSRFFARGQPCLRASPLTKSRGWAVHFDAQSRIALIDPASPLFAALSTDPGITCIAAMRNRRA